MTAPEYVVLAFIAFVLTVCVLAFIGALPWGWLADRAPSDPLDEKLELFDPAAAIAADVLDRAARERADDAEEVRWAAYFADESDAPATDLLAAAEASRADWSVVERWS